MNEETPSYLFVLPWSLDYIGGVSQVVENLINEMQRCTEYVPILMVNSWADKKIRKARIGSRCHYFFRLRSLWDSSKPLKHIFGWILHVHIELFRFIKFIKRNRVAVVNVHYCTLYALNISIAKKIGLFEGKFILSFHGADLLSARKAGRVQRQLWKLLLRSADNIVTCSESLGRDLALFDKRCSNKIIVIHNGINVVHMKEERDKHFRLDNRLEKRRIILNIGAFEWIKGQDLLIKAFAELAETFPDIDLVIIGRQPGALLQQLKALVCTLGLDHRVWFYVGVSHDKISTFLEKAIVFALPSRYESFGIVALEAGAFGIPVVAANVGGICEILTHNETGRLYEADDVEGLGRELLYLLENPEERVRLGGNLRKRVEECFSWERAYRDYVACIGG